MTPSLSVKTACIVWLHELAYWIFFFFPRHGSLYLWFQPSYTAKVWGKTFCIESCENQYYLNLETTVRHSANLLDSYLAFKCSYWSTFMLLRIFWFFICFWGYEDISNAIIHLLPNIGLNMEHVMFLYSNWLHVNIACVHLYLKKLTWEKLICIVYYTVTPFHISKDWMPLYLVEMGMQTDWMSL